MYAGEKPKSLRSSVPSYLREWAHWLAVEPKENAAPNLRRLLLVAYVFPPVGGSGVQRPAKLAKYLASLGWKLEVLTAGHRRFPAIDSSLLPDVPSDARIHAIGGLEPDGLAWILGRWFGRRVDDALHWRLDPWFRALGIEDPAALWAKTAVWAAKRIYQKDPFDAVVTTSPPHFTHFVGAYLAQKYEVPWVADLRDPLAHDFESNSGDTTYRTRMNRIEQIIGAQAHQIITTCPELTGTLCRRYPDRDPLTISTITNGFDRSDLRSLAENLAALKKSNDRCVFVAAGAFYGRRKLRVLVDAVRLLLNRRTDLEGKMQLLIAGTLDPDQSAYWEKEAPSWLTIRGYVSHADAVRLAACSACTVLVAPDCYYGRTSIPGKTFELIALPTHILALAPEDSDTARTACRAGACTCVPFEDIGGIADAMERIADDHIGGRLVHHRNWELVNEYDRREIAAKFDTCLRRLLVGA